MKIAHERNAADKTKVDAFFLFSSVFVYTWRLHLIKSILRSSSNLVQFANGGSFEGGRKNFFPPRELYDNLSLDNGDIEEDDDLFALLFELLSLSLFSTRLFLHF